MSLPMIVMVPCCTHYSTRNQHKKAKWEHNGTPGKRVCVHVQAVQLKVVRTLPVPKFWYGAAEIQLLVVGMYKTY